MNIHLRLFSGLAALAFPLALTAAESHCQADTGDTDAATPSSAFSDNGDGTVTHEETGLTWARCAVGQEWSNGGCDGRALVFRWEGATQAAEDLNANGGLAGHEDWRLPTRNELKSIVETCREAPAINTSIFPDTPQTGFWSSTSADERDSAWFVGFYKGLDYPYRKETGYRVRVVRRD